MIRMMLGFPETDATRSEAARDGSTGADTRSAQPANTSTHAPATSARVQPCLRTCSLRKPVEDLAKAFHLDSVRRPVFVPLRGTCAIVRTLRVPQQLRRRPVR